MSDDEAKFLEAIEKFGQDVLENSPGLKDVLQRFWSGDIEAHEAIKDVWRIVAQTPGHESELERAMFEAFGIEPRSTDLAHFPEREKMLERWGFDGEDLVFEPFEDRPGYKMLHPLLMGMIVELLQYDGDIPELRTGKLPEGGAPAVPVKTMSRNPVMLGALLKKASSEVALELAAAQEEHDVSMAKMITAVGGTGDAVTGLVRQETERGVAVPGYTPGSRAQIREVRIVEGPHELVNDPLAIRQERAHHALTSTQGRRSAIPVISQMTLDSLHKQGYTGVHQATEAHEDESIFAETEWTMGIDGGQEEHNPNFNFIDIAARALSRNLVKTLAGNASRYTSLTLRVSPVNTVAERRVGWRAVLYE